MKRITFFTFLLFSQLLLLAQPSNDDCANLIDLGVAPNCPGTMVFTNVGATPSVISSSPVFNIPTCFNSGTPNTDVWFSFSTPNDGSFVDAQFELTSVAGTNGGIVQPQMALYRGDCSLDGLDELACVTALAGETDLETVVLGLTPGTTYFLRVEDWSATATPNWGDFQLCIKDPDVIFNMGEETFTSFCSGTLFDSGGPDDDYSNGENFTFTICPNDPHACINFDFPSYNTENNFDFLNFYAGPDVNSPLFISFDGPGAATSFGISSNCATVEFTSDGSVTSDGFEMSWSCSLTPCDNTFSTCGDPDIIPALPFDANGLSTCGALNEQDFGACGFGTLAGEEYIFTYNSPGGECISVDVLGANEGSTISVYDACPNAANDCLGLASVEAGGAASIASAYLELAGTYFIVVDDNGSGCTDFDIAVAQLPGDCTEFFRTCNNPEVVPALPYMLNDVTTCGTLNSQTNGPCPFGLNLLDGEDYIFAYESPGDECIRVDVTGSDLGTGVSIYDACPEDATNCFGAAVTLDGDSAIISNSFLEMPGTYYIVVDNGSGCSDFSIEINSIVCPEALPPAVLCEDALQINGCGNLPSLIQVGQEETTEPECIQDGVNDGGWGGIGAGHFTWFYLQAQADGEFGFLAQNGSIFEDSDIDINVWGPIGEFEDMCGFMKTNQPARSTYAADNPDPLAFDFTGLINIDPTNGDPIDDQIEGAGGDGFVTTLPVTEGDWVLVLVNDFSGAIVNGGILMDFSSTTPGVLDAALENLAVVQPDVACPNVPFELEASGGAAYNWFPTTGLSCTDCPNPMVTVDGPSIYQVAISTACSVDTLDVDIAFLTVDAGDDLTVCEGEELQLGVSSSLDDLDWTWVSGGGTLSCIDCPFPILDTDGLAAGSYDYVATASSPDCADSDTVTVTVLGIAVPTYEIAEDEIICDGTSIALGGPNTPGVTYNWTSNVGGFTSDESNPSVMPTENTTYYLTTSNGECPNTIVDSVQIGVAESPIIPALNDEMICAGEEVIILNIVTATDITYTWNPLNGIANPALANNIFTPNETTTYTLTAARGDCVVEETFTITVIEQAEITTLDQVTICEGMSIDLVAEANLEGTFTWNPGNVTGSTFTTENLFGTTEFMVSFMDDNGCEQVQEMVTVIVEDAVEITEINSDQDNNAVPSGNTAVLTVTTDPEENNTFDWSTGETNSNSISVIPMETTTYSVTVTDQNGCTDVEMITLTVTPPTIDFPNAFTPDNDGVNDVFGPVIEGQVEIITFKVFNRWGEKVYDGENQNAGWDGMIDDKPATMDVYVYFITYQKPFEEAVTENGDITLIR